MPVRGGSKQPGSSRAKLATRACDPCKVRKIRCSQAIPCAGCVASGVDCTFTKAQATRGPKGIHLKTRNKISQSKQQSSPPGLSLHQSSTSWLADILDIYASRLYPIWPIVDVEELKRSLSSESVEPSGLNQLATVVALCTVAQLKMETTEPGVPFVPLELHTDENNRFGLQSCKDVSALDSLRISFFKHIYYENQEGGGKTSLLYLRDAITQAQIMRLEHETTYESFSEDDQQLYRRVLWLLFVTERGVALLHKLPAVLKPNVLLPWYGLSDDTVHILPDFLKLVHLFWVFDQSGMFDILRSADSGANSSALMSQSGLSMLQQSLYESTKADEWMSGNDIQRADVLITRQWMRAVLWRAAMRFGITIPTVNPLEIATGFLSLVAQIPSGALESHGPTLEFKTFEIATAVIDAMTKDDVGASYPQLTHVLDGLRNLLSISRGGNNKLISLLDIRMQAVTPTKLWSQPHDMERFVEDILMSMDEQGNWHRQDFFPQLQVSTVQSSKPAVFVPTSNASFERTSFLRSPSPLTRLLLDVGSKEHPH